MLSRVIQIGKNSAFPKTVRMSLGVGVDGCEITRPVQIRADECLCTRCAGRGHITTTPINPSERGRDETCPDCEGDGIVRVAA